MTPVIGLIEGASGNIASVRHALRRLGAETTPVHTPEQLVACNAVILPGVGNLPRVMESLRGAGFDHAICDFAASGKPLLGICVGMQALATSGSEGIGTECLNLIPGRVDQLRTTGLDRLPHIGWNDVEPRSASSLFASDTPFDAYFVHSYAFVPDDDAHATSHSTHGQRFAASVERDNVMGVQFHPEKSQRAGLALLERFLSLAA